MDHDHENLWETFETCKKERKDKIINATKKGNIAENANIVFPIFPQVCNDG